MYTKLRAFTLVELIVVITILAILGTIGFVSLQGYSINARDSVRISDTKTFIKALNIYHTKHGEVPLPDDMTTITGSGVVFSYQGTLSGRVITELGQGQVPLDPLLKTPYLYATNEGRTKAQLLSYHEKKNFSLKQDSIQTYAEVSVSDMFPKVIGEEVGILLDTDNRLISSGELDIFSTGSGLILYVNNERQLSDLDSVQNYLNFGGKGSSCKDILDASKTPPKSGVYTITFESGDQYDVYCDMLTDGGGWTYVQGGRISSSTADEEFSIYRDTSNQDFQNLELLYKIPHNIKNQIHMQEFRTVYEGTARKYWNIGEFENAVEFQSGRESVQGKSLVRYRVFNDGFSSEPYELENCEFGTDVSTHLFCNGQQETQHPWYQSSKIHLFSEGDESYYGAHNCFRFIGPEYQTHGQCNVGAISPEMLYGVCQGERGYYNYITHPDCAFRDSSENFFLWQEWLR